MKVHHHQHHQGHAKDILITLLFFSLSELLLLSLMVGMGHLLSMRIFYYDVSLSSCVHFDGFCMLYV